MSIQAQGLCLLVKMIEKAQTTNQLKNWKQKTPLLCNICLKIN